METINKLNFDLTNDQKKVLNEINCDLISKSKMFRLLQGDVGSGKTIVALISALNVIESGYQVAFMAPTEILSRQHYVLASKIFKGTNIKINILTGKSSYIEKKEIASDLKSNNTNILFHFTPKLRQRSD